ncbi:hypothetical protein N7491_009923 [Penicillium cf. griseofulvum]|nr:hypothetical protein N7491_009923 [Penicillium cf. griseofulvum]
MQITTIALLFLAGMGAVAIPIESEANGLDARAEAGALVKYVGKLKDFGFREITPDRRPCPELLETLPDPDKVIEEIKKTYKRPDESTVTFEYPINHNLDGRQQLNLMPNSFANLTLPNVTGDVKQDMVCTAGYEIYGNVCHPLEEPLVESFMKGAIDDMNDANAEFSVWGETLSAWVSLMCGYLEVNNDILDHCQDARAVKWFSEKYGRQHEEKLGPWDRRVSKRLGSGRELPVDMRGNPLPM